MKRNKVIRWAANAVLAFGVVARAGIAKGDGLLSNDGVLAPRSGEIFQSTRMGMGNGAKACSFLTAGGLIAVSEGRPIGWPFAIIGLPFAAVGFVLDEVIVSPLTDLVCLPYDLMQPNHGFYIRIVDEKGKPLPHARIEGYVKNQDSELPWEKKRFSGETDDAGEFYVSRLFNLTGGFRVTAAGYMPWYGLREIQSEQMNKGPDGRIVIEHALQKSGLTGWQEKKGLTRDEVLSLLPGKWSAESDTRAYLSAELKWPPDRDDRHCFTLEASGTVVSGVPECYRNAYCKSDPWRGGLHFSVWQLHRKGELKMAWYSKEPKSWSWAVRLSKDKGEYSSQDEYYLGEDEEGLYLSPGLHSEFVGVPEVALKFRKVE